ncbi:unnamed protein product, partial [Rotaria sp. Silwood2]
VDGQSEQRLRQAKTNYAGERIILIPYNLGDFHWIGVIIKFKVDEQIELAEFINPVKESNFIPDKLQREFRNVFPSTVLRSRVSQIHGDQQYSAFLTIKNLLKAVKESEFAEIKSSNMNLSHIQVTDDRQRMNCLFEDQSLN